MDLCGGEVIASNMWLTILTLRETAALACSQLNGHPSGRVIFSTSAMLFSSHTALREIWLGSVQSFSCLLIIVVPSPLSSPRVPFFSLFLSNRSKAVKWFPSVPPLNPVICCISDLVFFCFDTNVWMQSCAMLISHYKSLSCCESNWILFLQIPKETSKRNDSGSTYRTVQWNTKTMQQDRKQNAACLTASHRNTRQKSGWENTFYQQKYLSVTEAKCFRQKTWHDVSKNMIYEL